MSIAQTIIQELEAEAATTRRVLERVPESRFDWSPHPKSRTLGTLAMHIAGNPGSVMALASQNPAGVPGVADVTPTTLAQVLTTLDASVAEARHMLEAMPDASFAETWRLESEGKELMAMPRAALLRMVLLNHWYHHRGQLSVYLRALDVPLPSIYGPSADENPFA
jgi:uncharacterized damage-inducible protein DinB